MGIIIGLCILAAYLLLGWLVLKAVYLGEDDKYDEYAISFWLVWPAALLAVYLYKMILDDKKKIKRKKRKRKSKDI